MIYGYYMSYINFAEYYDSLTGNVSYRSIADCINKILVKHNHKSGITLDLACGTGSLTSELKKRGYDVYGVDMSVPMLSIARQKAAENGLDIMFLCQQMDKLDLFGTIDTCVCVLDSINHITDENILKKAFERVALFMVKDGLFIFDVNTVHKHRTVLGNNTYVYDLPDVYCVWQNRLSANNIVNIDLDFFEKKGNLYSRTSEHFCERAYDIDYLKKLLEDVGFSVDGIYKPQTFDTPDEKDERVVFVARKLKDQ